MAERPQHQPENVPPKETPVRPEIVEHLRGVIAQTGGKVDVTDPRYVAVHGTSEQTLKRLLQTGRIPGVTHSDPFKSYEPGDVSIIPTPTMDVPDHLRTDSIKDFQINPQEVDSYGRINAEIIAQRHEFLTHIGRPLTGRREGELADGSVNREADPDETERSDAYFRQTGLSQEVIITAADAARPKRGFLLGIGNSALEDEGLYVMEGDPDVYDLRFRSTDGEGLPYEHIAGIEPLGPDEKKFLEDLGIPVPEEGMPGVSELRTGVHQVDVPVAQTPPIDKYLGSEEPESSVFQRYGLESGDRRSPQKEHRPVYEVEE